MDRIPILNAYSKNRDVEKRTDNARYLTKHLAVVHGLTLPAEGLEETCYIYPISSPDREGIVSVLNDVGVETVSHENNDKLFYVPCHDGMQRYDLDLIIEVVDNYFSTSRRQEIGHDKEN